MSILFVLTRYRTMPCKVLWIISTPTPFTYRPPNLAKPTKTSFGQFQGIGVEFNIFKDTVHVLYVIPNGPSDKAGLQIGDKILGVNDSSIVSKTLTSERIKK